MDILISFTTSVGVTESLRTVKNVAIDAVNQSIVQWLKNKKIPNPWQPDRPFNNRELNSTILPPGYRTGRYLYLMRTVTEYDYHYYFYSDDWYGERERSSEGGFKWKEVFGGVVVRSESEPAAGARVEPAGRFSISFIPPSNTLNTSSYTNETSSPVLRNRSWNLSVYSASLGD